MEKQKFQDASRAQVSFLAPLEKRVLVWLAHRMPSWVNSDHLTLLGLIGMLGAGVNFWLARWEPASLLLVVFWLAVNWFGDSLDGTLARVRNRQRPRYGFYVDHIIDAFGTLFLLGGMAVSGYMTPYIGLGLIVVYFLLSIEVYLATYTIGTFHLSFWKFSPTELRLLLCVGSVVLLFRPKVTLFGGTWLLFDVGGIAGIAGMFVMALHAAIRHTRHLYRMEALPPLSGDGPPTSGAGASNAARPGNL